MSDTKIKVNHLAKASFRCSVLKADKDGNPIESTEREVAPWQKNLIVDSGIELLPQGTFLDCLQIGTGNTTPATTDTQLTTYLTGTNNEYQADDNTSSTSVPYSMALKRYFEFTAGQATGTIAELGLASATSGATITTHALIKDGVGSPTTITVLSDEILRVDYETELLIDTSDQFGNVTLDGISTATVTRPAELDLQAIGIFVAGLSVSNLRLYDNTSTLGTVTGSPSGTSLSNFTPNTKTYNPQVSGVATADIEITAGVNDLNIGDCAAAKFTLSRWCDFQVSFSPAFNKTNQKELKLTLQLSWARA